MCVGVPTPLPALCIAISVDCRPNLPARVEFGEERVGGQLRFRFPAAPSVATPQAVSGWAHPPCRRFKIQLLAAVLGLLSWWQTLSG
jgi:hypothetical protein